MDEKSSLAPSANALSHRSAAVARIVVVDDDTAAKARGELEKDPDPELLAPPRDGELSLKDKARRLVRRKADDSVALLLSSVIKMRQATLDITIVSDSEATRLSFPPGHPTRGVLYISHPVLPGTYYPASSFHRFVVEHKFAEAIDLLMELGARTMEIELIRGYKKEDVFDILSSIPVVKIGARTSKDQESSSHIHCVAELEGSTEPRLPDDAAWLSHEPMWKTLADNRLEKRLKKFHLAVRHLDSMSVDRELEAAAKGAGIRLGGAFHEHEEVVIQISGEFATENC